jgi:hypothetical protein
VKPRCSFFFPLPSRFLDQDVVENQETTMSYNLPGGLPQLNSIAWLADNSQARQSY